MKNESAFSGLEAAIVLIAFVVVAAVFSYVMLGAGFFATQKAQEVTYAGVKQSTSNLVFDGYLYASSSHFTSLTFYIKVPEGGDGQIIDPNKVTILYSKGGSIGTPATFSNNGPLNAGERTKVVLTALTQTGPGCRFTIELKPDRKSVV